MKKAKLLTLSILAISSIALTACNMIGGSSSTGPSNNQTSSSVSESTSNGQTSSSQNQTTTSSSSSQGPSSQSSAQAKQNVVLCEEKAHVTITPSKDMAAYGDIVELDIKLDSGYEIDHIEVNGSVITGTSFVMPNRSAYVVPFVYLTNAAGFMLTGDVSEQLVKDPETGIYVARNVKCNADTNVAYSINNKVLSVTAINNSKTFADIKLPSSGTEKGFTVAGGATYDFYYDPTDPVVPCYVKRTKVDLPQTAKALESIFGGRVKSETCVYPEGVTKVEYESSKRNDSYVWELYSDNSSLATVKDYAGRKDKGIVYKSIDGSVYTVVDSYVEKHDGHDTTSTERDDSKKFAGKYDVVDSVASGYKKYQYLKSDAIVDANMYSHTMESIDFDIMYAYRTGFENIVSDDIYTSNISVTSTPNLDGSFNTKIKSWVSVKKNGAYSTTDASYHNEYDVDLVFTDAGALLEVTYNHKEYTEKQYDFDRNKFKTGGEDDPAAEKDVHAKYTYGQKKEGKPNLDLTPYFVSSIKDLKIVNSKGEDSKVERMDTLEMFEEASTYNKDGAKYVSCTYEPSTALDYWQYGIVNSSNKQVVNNKNNDAVSYPFDWVGNQGGETTLTIGNHTKSTGVKATLAVTSDAQVNNIKSVWAYTVHPYTNEKWTASSGYIYAGGKDKVKICASLTNNSYDQHPDVTVTSSNESLLTAEYNIDDGYLYLDAKGARLIETETTVTISIAASYADGWSPSSLSVKIVPTQNAIESVVGDWEFANSYVDPEDATYNATLSFTDSTGTFVITVKGSTYEITFDYTFDKDNQTIVASNKVATKNGTPVSGSVDMSFDIDVSTGYIGAYVGIETIGASDGEMTKNVLELIGSAVEDEGSVEYSYADFKPVQK